MRTAALVVVALLAAPQGGAAYAAGRSFSHSGGRVHSGVSHFHSGVAFRPVRVVPRFVYVAPYVPYYSAPYYSTPSYYNPSYYPDPAYSEPSYIEPSQQYAPPQQQYAPPPPPQSAQPQPGPYSMEQGIQYRYLCLDTRKFYPDTKECPSGWITVVPGARSPY